MSIHFCTLLLFLLSTTLAQSSSDNGIIYNNTDPDINASFSEIVVSSGFLFEEHTVHTEDGYILHVFRIPRPAEELIPHLRRPPVLLWHGIMDSADAWVMHWDYWAPAFMLARRGYDVWLPNTRGNKYSKEHEWLDVDSREFWDFSFDEVGQYDLPAVIEYVKKSTRQEKVAYIGHSMGTTQMFSALTHNSSYFSDSLTTFIALGPVLNLSHSESELIQFVAQYESTLNLVFSLLGIYEVFPEDWWLSEKWGELCALLPPFCSLALELVSDEKPWLNSVERTPVYMGHYPSGTSLKALVHYGQIMNAERFQRYDYGSLRNKFVYKREHPPMIDVSKISDVPIGMFVGQYDLLADPTDNQITAPQLSTLNFYKEYEIGHLGFFLAREMEYFRDDVISYLDGIYSDELQQ